MISIFNGRQRRLGEASKDEIFVKVEVSLRDNLRHFKPAEFLVFMAIALRIDEDGECFPSYDQLEGDTGLTRATVAKAVKGLSSLRLDGHAVISVRRERDDRGHFVGNNIYCVFPDDTQSIENPTLGKSNFSKSTLEEEPVRKEEPITTEARSNGKPAERERDPLFDAIAEHWHTAPGQTALLKSVMLGTNKKYSLCNFSPPAAPDEVAAFVTWYRRKFPDINLPVVPEKLQSHFYAFRKSFSPSRPESRIVDGIEQHKVGGTWYIKHSQGTSV